MNRSTLIAACGAGTLVAMAFTMAGTALVQTAAVAGPSVGSTVAAISVAAEPAAGQLATGVSSESQAAGAAVLAEGTAAPATVNEKNAEKVIRDAAEGKILSVEHGQYKNTNVWGVTVQRSDGSVVAGYVNDTSGEVIGWEVLKQAPQRTQVITVAATSGVLVTHHEENEQERSGNDD